VRNVLPSLMDGIQRSHVLVPIILLMLLIPVVDAQGEVSVDRYILANKSVADDGATAPLIEWFCNSDINQCNQFEEDNALSMDKDEGMVWLSWHPSINSNDPLSNSDSNFRADELSAQVPAIRVDFQRLEGIEDGPAFNPVRAGLALNGTTPDAGGVVAAELPLEVTLIDIDGDEIVDEIDIESDFKPLVNLSSDVILNIALVEWYPEVWNEGVRPPHVVREWTATQAFSKRAGNVTHLVSGFGFEHLEAAGIRINSDDSQRWGLVAFLAGHAVAEGGAAGEAPPPSEPSVVLAMTEMNLPTMWEGTSMNEALPRIGFLTFAIICVIIIILTEKQREGALPRITGRLLNDDQDGDSEEVRLVASLDIRIGKYSARMGKVEISDPWKMKKRVDLSELKADSEHSIRLQIKGTPEDIEEPVVIRFSLEVETYGNWVMDLSLMAPRG